MKLESIWLGAKIFFLVFVGIGITIVGKPVLDKVLSLLDKKEQLYNEQMIRLADNQVSQRVEFSNKLLEQKIEQLDKRILEVANARNQDIVEIGNMVASLRQDMSEQIGSYYKDKNDPSKDYVETVIKKKMPDNSELPVGWAMYSPNIEGDEKWTTGTYPMKVHTKVAIGENEDRSDAYVESYITSDVFNADKGKKFPLTVDTVEWVKAPPKEKTWMYNPRISLGFGVASDVFGSLEVSFFSYGRSKGDMDWRFLGIGAGVSDDNEYLYVVPASYNIGNHIPLVDNIFVSPFVGIDEDSATWGIQLQIPF